jgi:hypothetical protein
MDVASSARSLLSGRSAPLARNTALISSGHWAGVRSGAAAYLEEAISLSRHMGFRIAEFETQYVLLQVQRQSGRPDSQVRMDALLIEMRRAGVRSIARRATDVPPRFHDVASLR